MPTNVPSAPTHSERSRRYEIYKCFQTPGVCSGESFVCVCALGCLEEVRAPGALDTSTLIFVFVELIRSKANTGFVRQTDRELADHMRARALRRELTPISKRSGAVLFEDIAAVEVTFLVEVIVDRSMGGGEFLQGFDVPELRHRTLSSSKRLV